MHVSVLALTYMPLLLLICEFLRETQGVAAFLGARWIGCLAKVFSGT